MTSFWALVLCRGSFAKALLHCCPQENQRDGVMHQSADHTKEISPAAKTQPIETSKKGQVCVCLYVLMVCFDIQEKTVEIFFSFSDL